MQRADLRPTSELAPVVEVIATQWARAAQSSFQTDYRCQGENDDLQLPVMLVFKKRDGRIFLFWSTEGMSNHVDTVWSYWNLLDFTPEGRPDRQTPPQRFKSEFLEKNYLNKE